MKVSVCMITYNHEKFITQAVESVMMQKTDFDYELVIGEDCSIDRTREIVIELQEKYADKIRLLLPQENLGMHRNFAQTLEACTGEYVAFLEGDDYWTSPCKLQKQVEILDRNSEFVICFHNAKGFFEDKDHLPFNLVHENRDRVYSVEDLLVGPFVITCCTMVRRAATNGSPEWVHSLGMAEWPFFILTMLNRPQSRAIYLNEFMSAYRVHGGGIWSSLSDLQAIQELLRAHEAFLIHLPRQYHQLIKKHIFRCWFHIGVFYEESGDRENAKVYFAKFKKGIVQMAARFLLGQGLHSREMVVMLARVYAPAFYKLCKGRGKHRTN